MTKNEMLLKLLNQSGWTVTTDTDDEGYAKCVATEKTEKADV